MVMSPARRDDKNHTPSCTTISNRPNTTNHTSTPLDTTHSDPADDTTSSTQQQSSVKAGDSTINSST